MPDIPIIGGPLDGCRITTGEHRLQSGEVVHIDDLYLFNSKGEIAMGEDGGVACVDKEAMESLGYRRGKDGGVHPCWVWRGEKGGA